MWNDLSPIWKIAFKEAWDAFSSGSPPIGAVLCDSEGNVLLSDHNRNNEPLTLNKRTAHAEANILHRLDTSKFDPKSLTLYSTMEPCPMCMGTILMSNIKRVRYAAADDYCGMTRLLQSDPYYSSKNVSCVPENGEHERFQITIQAYFELGYIERGAGTQVFDKFMESCPSAAKGAKQLYAEKWLDNAVNSHKDVSEVYDHIMSYL